MTIRAYKKNVNMIKPMVLAGILLVVGMALGEETIAHWDFSRGTIDSVDGKIKMHFRGHTRLEGSEGKQFLNVGINNKDRPEGIIAKEKYPQLTPKGAFRLEIKARLRAQTGTTPLVLWDTHYHLNPKNPEQDKNKGFCFYLVRNKDGRFRPQAAFGFATSLDMAYGELVELEENQNFTIALEYDGEKTVSFILNGELNRLATLKNGGSLAEAVYPLVIGDRYGSSYNRFDGQILEVKLAALAAQE